MKESRGMLQDKEAQPIIKNESTRSSNHDGVWCTYYKKPHHTKETCWKLHGKPQGVGRNGGFKGGQQRREAHLTHAEGHPYENSNLSSSETEGFNKEEIERLGNLLNSLKKQMDPVHLYNQTSFLLMPLVPQTHSTMILAS
ncbi:hypothetical protein CK203_063583 [Vitis vinifera]|uniref:Uncharacterized protein n=1 Tax=Vitis vinifera TaxID=29760 RepID=A0A438G7S3_VITVI|nr:hypothetical protein CK203_063583 [Vitis vinifera]